MEKGWRRAGEGRREGEYHEIPRFEFWILMCCDVK